MPELPEVETVARQLAPRLAGRTVRRLTILDDRLRVARPPALAGARVADVLRIGKQVALRFVHGRRPDVWLAVHLRMTGRLIHDDARGPLGKHVRARFGLDRGRLTFVDPRRFGTFAWHRDPDAIVPDAVDPLSRSLDARRMRSLLGASRTPIKPWLLRQDRLVGLGNIYASEILHDAGIAPDRPAGSLADDEIARLTRSTKRILRRAIRACGTTFSDFQDANGVEGSYQRYLRVYARDGEGCRRCGTAVERIVQQQRSTFWCAGCQT